MTDANLRSKIGEIYEGFYAMCEKYKDTGDTENCSSCPFRNVENCYSAYFYTRAFEDGLKEALEHENEIVETRGRKRSKTRLQVDEFMKDETRSVMMLSFPTYEETSRAADVLYNIKCHGEHHINVHRTGKKIIITKEGEK